MRSGMILTDKMKLEDFFNKVYVEAASQKARIITRTKGDKYSKQHHSKSYLKKHEISGVVVKNPGKRYEICEIHLYNHNTKYKTK